jgi:hypothetical protein
VVMPFSVGEIGAVELGDSDVVAVVVVVVVGDGARLLALAHPAMSVLAAMTPIPPATITRRHLLVVIADFPLLACRDWLPEAATKLH